MADPLSTASTKLPHQRLRESRATSGVPSGAGGAGCRAGGAATEAAPGERARLASDDAEGTARLLEKAFVFMVEENELSMPAVEQLYAALQAAEATVTVLGGRLSRGHRRGDFESGGRGIGREP